MRAQSIIFMALMGIVPMALSTAEDVKDARHANVENLLDCLIAKVPPQDCSPMLPLIKQMLPRFLENDCATCHDELKKQFDYAKTNYTDKFNIVKAKYTGSSTETTPTPRQVLNETGQLDSYVTKPTNIKHPANSKPGSNVKELTKKQYPTNPQPTSNDNVEFDATNPTNPQLSWNVHGRKNGKFSFNVQLVSAPKNSLLALLCDFFNSLFGIGM